MGLLSKRVLGIDITVSVKNNILEEIRKYLKKVQSSSRLNRDKVQSDKKKPLIIFTPNPEIINYAQKEHIFKQIVNSAQINIPDGAGIEWGIKKLYGNNIVKFSGVDLMGDLCSYSAKEGLIIGLIGGRDGVALAALECLRRSYNNLSGWAMDGPEVQITNYKLQITNKVQNSNDQIKEITEKIIREKTAILFVGLGYPKQEYFIDKLKIEREKLKINHPLVLMAVGGSFDYISGRITRAPSWMREKGLEWLFRLVREPWRLFRQIKGSIYFLRVLVH